jgi:enoyl-CoA hydratase/carnithine racemase
VIDLTRDGDVFVLTMRDGENRLSPTMLDAFDAALTEVSDTDGPRALVTTGTDKFFSNGLDLDWLGDHPDEMLPYLGRVHGLFARILSMPCATVAACNGHTFAAGAMLAIAHDVRLMRADRGYWCLPEVDLGMPFTPGMNALIPARIPAMTAHEAMVTGRRYTAHEAVAAGIVARALPEAEVVPEAVAAARTLAAKAGPGIATIRTTLHAPVLQALSGGG